MWAKRAAQLQDLSVLVELDPLRCLDAADVIARHAERYGIGAQLELRRNASGRIDDRHYVLCHHAGPLRSISDSPSQRPLWIMHVVLRPEAHGCTRVVAGLQTYRRRGRGVEAGRAAQRYREVLADALDRMEAQRPAAPPARPSIERGNVIPLRPFLPAELRPGA